MNSDQTVKTRSVLPQTDLQIARAAFATALKQFVDTPSDAVWGAVKEKQAEVERIEQAYHSAYIQLLANVCDKQKRSRS